MVCCLKWRKGGGASEDRGKEEVEKKVMAGLSVLLEGRQDMAASSAKLIKKSFVTRSLSSRLASPRHHFPSTRGFLESCFLCGKHLSLENDIYMYRLRFHYFMLRREGRLNLLLH